MERHEKRIVSLLKICLPVYSSKFGDSEIRIYYLFYVLQFSSLIMALNFSVYK